jgi:hypothetical protein
MRIVFGFLIVICDLVVLFTGFCLTFAGLGLLGSGGGQGNIKIVIEKAGEISGIDGHLAVIVLGVAMMVVSVILALQGFKETRVRVGRLNLGGFLRYVVPLP